METNRISAALARIEVAAARIEGAAARPASSGDLQQRHDRLRAETTAALADLDRLIGSIGA